VATLHLFAVIIALIIIDTAVADTSLGPENRIPNISCLQKDVFVPRALPPKPHWPLPREAPRWVPLLLKVLRVLTLLIFAQDGQARYAAMLGYP
jgi:hypothetical protein